jgi:ribonucleoside-diphosphate reductase alpha chain
MSREHLPNRRASVTFDFEHEPLTYTCSFSCFGDGRPAENFSAEPQGGSHADVVAREAAIAASIALQYGCPIQTLQHAALRNPNGKAAGPLGCALDLIVEGMS